MKFNFKNPFTRKPTPSQQLMNDVKLAAVTSMQESIMSMIGGIFNGAKSYSDKKKYKIIMEGKAVEEVHADKKKDEAEQDEIFAEFMSMMNGDRDIEYDVPPEIEIKAFDNDSMTEEERDEIYNIIDTINEANDIARDGKFRTKESVREEEQKSREKAAMETNSNAKTDGINRLIEFATPFINMIMMMLATTVSLTMISKMAAIIDRF